MVNATACHAVDWEFDPPPSRHFREYSSMVELLTLNQQVQGSNPCVPTILLSRSSVAEQEAVNFKVARSTRAGTAIF